MAPGEPREGNKPEPVGNIGILILATTFTLGLLYFLWRRASSLRAVVSHQLKTWTTQEGRIRLSEDDGPAATEFLVDDEASSPINHVPPPQATNTLGIDHNDNKSPAGSGVS